MAEKRILVVDAEVAAKIDENRGDMSRSEFINLLIDSQLKGTFEKQGYITEEEFYHSQREIKELLRHFLEFFVSYGLEVGNPPDDKTLGNLNQKLQNMTKPSSKTK